MNGRSIVREYSIRERGMGMIPYASTLPWRSNKRTQDLIERSHFVSCRTLINVVVPGTTDERAIN
ncbi:unnamed protein product [Ilex paraguariensis]|uniref:Uncharacterized protein n=1 Tax=Ilex paraguariensis TaxID=185542 RepID=A0ABC8T8M4_9AQUA